MDCQELISQLGYKDNPAFLQGERLKEHLGYSFFFTQAQRDDRCKLRGVYVLDGPEDQIIKSSIAPVVYVCEAQNEQEAAIIHKRVWYQNTVPFIIIITPKNIRLYSGFAYENDRGKTDDQVLGVIKNANEILDKLSAFTSRAIDSGEIWEHQKITTEKRVDRQLLSNLDKLSKVLVDEEPKLPIEEAHTLIGKYIYLKYLRDREILSNKRFSDAGLDERDIFGSSAKKEKLYQLEGYLNGFLNGSVFPLPNRNRISAEHIRKVASTFKGDDPESSQQVLFDLYDFSYVPIETLSVVYQQFLHQKDEGRHKGAYYTPVHLVNFILDELEDKKPLKEGIKIFDPSCGSGAFLVQCYRRLVEGIVRKGRQKLNPSDLRSLLEKHIFGLDADEEACRVAELSLSLTLLDYINPPDLSKTNFKLPNLHNKNIFHCKGGFFDEGDVWTNSIPEDGYEWIIGNPPWKNIDRKKSKEKHDTKAIEWIDNHKEEYPVDNYQIAEAFIWKVSEILSKDGQCGLLMPAMTLFKTQGYKFRSKFFGTMEVWQTVNFANLRHLLFEGAVNPAAVFFFSGRRNWDKSEHYITTYAPFAVEQSSQLNKEEKSQKLWTVYINTSNIKDIPNNAVESGSSIPWKIAMWGTRRDERILELTMQNNITLEKYLSQQGIKIFEGSQLRDLPVFRNQKEKEDFHENHKLLKELINKGKIDKDKLTQLIQNQKIALEFPKEAIVKIKAHEAYLRKRGGEGGLAVSHPPHIIISSSRKSILFSNEYIFVSPRQIGISGNDQQLLKALTLYLHSNYVHYQQFLVGEALGIERDCVNFNSLKKIPLPFSTLRGKDIYELSSLYGEIVEAEKQSQEDAQDAVTPLFRSKVDTSLSTLDALLKKMNSKVYDLLGIKEKQRWLIEDFLNVRIKMNDGKIAHEAIQRAGKKEITEFAQIFQEELDIFLDYTGKKKVHQVKVYYANHSAVLVVEHLLHDLQSQPQIIEVQDTEIRRIFNEIQDKLTEKKSQWMYFTRGLRIYEREKKRTYIFKPRQRLYWLKSQALADADEFIAEKVGAKE